jgi:hypothetical protein
VLTLYVPRAIPIVTGLAGALWVTPSLVTVFTGGAVSLNYAIANVLVSATLLYFALRTLLIRVTLDAAEVRVRSRLRTKTVPLEGIKGIALLQDGGVPTLRVVRHQGDALVVPAWSLRARDSEDDEVEPAGEALQRYGSRHGVKIRVRQLLGESA